MRPTRRSDEPQSFIGAVHEKYASGDDAGSEAIVFGRKVAQEMGFDKIRRQQAQLGDLRVLILDNMRAASARADGERSVRETCPSTTQLDLSRNLFETLLPVVDLCRDLENLRKLRLKYVSA